MRKPIIAGNWKMNKTPAEAAALIEALKPLVADAELRRRGVRALCGPLRPRSRPLQGSNIDVGAQNMPL